MGGIIVPTLLWTATAAVLLAYFKRRRKRKSGI
jgi:hypothetical protein